MVELLNEQTFLDYIDMNAKAGLIKCNYGFSIVNKENWKTIVDCHISLHGIDGLLFAAIWANRSEQLFLSSEDVDDFDKFSGVIQNALIELEDEVSISAKLVDSSYNFLKKLWLYEKYMEYPLDVIERLIYNFKTNQAGFKVTLPYSVNF